MPKPKQRAMTMHKASAKARKAARAGYKKAAKKPLGEGSRFKAIEKSAKASGAANPAAVAAAAGRAKYGAKKMAKLSAAGRKK